jgi:hypothetical protein
MTHPARVMPGIGVDEKRTGEAARAVSVADMIVAMTVNARIQRYPATKKHRIFIMET